MGVNLKDLIPEEAKMTIEDLRMLRGKIVVIDGYNALYQFLTAIRQPDGTPLMDSQGRITSHLSGLFYRTINILENGIKPAYVFDGKPPEIKAKEIEKRRKIREDASKKYEEALRKGDIEAARRYAMMSAKLTDEMVQDAKKLLDAMGIPWIQAPAEGEAQAAYIVSKGDAWASASQDYDSLLFGSPRLIRNLTISGKRKLPRKNVYIEIKPEIIELKKLLEKLGLTREQLIYVAILIGTDYNPDGVKGIGPKKALQLVKAYKTLDKILKIIPKTEFPIEPEKIVEYFLNPPVSTDYKLEWRAPDESKIREILVEEHDFNPERVKNAVERLVKAYREHIKSKQLGLEAWFS
ncbi:flap endonuclease 1 [Staphylothermus marinus F1]|uniref:Flap endonuclease 1 n=1 Tax=Staphylothermus marinus (strain ATCC 43588 / DSM 3639 / JCM 9404 / F1) TaxID=399550 RepID=FEN_STAMF|nr:flap endonuclease-1 [Staphylothermus marinus]A3DMG2.1 RecName: Full=Flap endonuclease 1; Short=FEN-1; AltName: Full=Flap structure-specific endonuclease 1 [Staphylothermus marinus F1]ABN69822.1 flap endonuclease 1 [Staphylothermus marinus F1]